MQIRRPRGITVPQLMVVTALGFVGGVYIWQPLIVKWKSENNPKPTEQTAAETVVLVDSQPKQINSAK